MYARVLHDELVFPEERAIDKDTRSLLRGLLQADPALRLGEPRIKKHPYFQMISWEHVYHKRCAARLHRPDTSNGEADSLYSRSRYIPPYTPPTDPENALDTQNFDDAFLDMAPTIDGDAGDEGLAAAPSAANAAAAAEMADRASLWGGYSYRERDAASIFTVGSEQDGSYGRKSSELLRGSMDSSRLGVGPEGYASLEGTLAAPAVPSDHPQQPSNDDSLDTVDRPAPEASTTSYSSLEESLQEPPISPVSVHANIGRTGIAAVDRDRLNSSDSEPDAGPVEADSNDDDDDGWDVIEKPRAGLQAENGLRAPTLFARGVIDRYRFGDLRRRESKAVLGRQTSPFEQPAVPPISVQTATPPTSFSSRRGLTFKGGRFRRKVNSDLQNLGELKTAPASLKGSTSTPSSLGQAPLMPPMSPPIPSGFSTPRGTASPSTPRPELSSRSSSVSPTKASGRSSSGMASEDDGPIAGTGSRLSSGEKLKLFGRSGQEKVLSLFKTGS
jgi:serum/glucocorticoid-regulated kinase 2